jgi:ankyrin repeat protein
MKMNIFRKYIISVLVVTFLLIASNVNASPKANDMLIKGALTGNIKLVKKAIKNGADLNSKEPAKGNTALMLAAYYKHHKIVDLLIQSKADVNERDLEANTALMKAAWTGGVKSAKLLIKAKTDINAKEINGMTALMIAAFYGHIDIVKLLVQANCDTSIKDNDGYTALMNAQHQKHTDIVKFLTKIDNSK